MSFRLTALVLLAIGAAAQDTRNVKEPVVPQPCVTLEAQLRLDNNGSIQPSDETHADTARIQQAIDDCPNGRSVELQAGANGTAFLSGPLQLKSGSTLLVVKGATLLASRNPRDYDVTPGSCGVVDRAGHGCKALINGNHADHAGLMGNGTIDGRGGWKLLGQDVSWWDLAQQAKATNQNQNCPRLLVLSHCDDFTLYKITLKNSPNFHVSYNGGYGFTAWGVIIDAPKSARNTDCIDPANSKNVTITHCFIHTGDDQVAIKAGGGGGPSTHMTISHNHFYTGHGMSVGSETDAGANNIQVSDLTIDGADNGIRIKSNSSRGGLVEDILYTDVCIRNTKNPIYMDSNYSFFGAERNKLPVFRAITLRDIHISGGGTITLEGYDSAHRLQMNFDGVSLFGPVEANVVAKHARIVRGPGSVNFRPGGSDVEVSGAPAEGKSADSCEARFVPMPGRVGN